jgi:CDP-6-deoxy-D-xylo-4-hexulose-3-dehydrase
MSSFIAGKTFIPASGQVVGDREKDYMHDAVDKGWLTAGAYNSQFEQGMAKYLGCKAVRTVNSGSSANLVAFSALTSPKLGDRAIKRGDEVISVACGFPTTINPILQFGAVPVFIDVDLTLNIDPIGLELAINDKTKAIFLAHTLGNPFNLDVIMDLAKKYNLWVIEDCCDALGAEWRGQKVGTFGHLSTLSFFPAHHITMGEGGAVIVNDMELLRLVESFRDWGRDCWCAPGSDNTCGMRFDQKHGDLPQGYDHKYVFSHVGYNLKITEMQAACGVAQLEQVEEFVKARRDNYKYLRNSLQEYDKLWFPLSHLQANPSWFGFPITLAKHCDFDRDTFVRYLNENKIGTRLLFAGNATKQPFLKDQIYRIHGELVQTDYVMNNTLWVGVQPAITQEMREYMATKIHEFMGGF